MVETKKEKAKMGNPLVSVVILSMNPPKSLITDLYNQTYRNFEIIVAREKGIVNAMNKALEEAKGEILVRIDDDVELPPKWLEQLIWLFSDHEVAGVTGPTFVPKERRQNRDSIKWAENPKGVIRWLYDNGQFMPGGIRKSGCVSYDSNYEDKLHQFYFLYPKWKDENYIFEPERLEGTNWAVRTDLLRQVGGFDPKFDGVCEWHDDDAHAKIRKLGYRFAYNPKAYLYHMLEQGNHYNERFDGFGRIKNFLRFHWRHGRHRFLNIKFYVYLTIWMGYFVCKRLKFL